VSRFLACDPGETTGWVLFENDQPVGTSNSPRPQFAQVLVNTDVDYYVVENFRMFPGKAKALIFNEMVAARVIGEIEHVARNHNRPIHFQMSEILNRAYPKFGYERKKGKHQLDALMHGLWYLHKDDPPDASEQLPSQHKAPDGERPVRRPTRVAQISGYEGLAGAWRKAGVGMRKKGL
jgi:hypothetical protein